MITITKIHRQMDPETMQIGDGQMTRNAWEIAGQVDGNPVDPMVIIQWSKPEWADKNAASVQPGVSFNSEHKPSKFLPNTYKIKGKAISGGAPASAPASSGPAYTAPKSGGKTFVEMAAEYNGCLTKAKELAGPLGITEDSAVVAMAATLFIRCEHEGITPDLALADSLKQDGPEPVYTPPSSSVDDDLPF